ncbi:MAG TPA: dihydroneopterin aldolase [Panacibacter sp.]|nr:dihydroneopterin aldolase [Panacibacter sp.]HNP45140.1 dihydroneopterin aldolase [Panacibacter sp.]
MLTVELNELRFFAHHGLYSEEKKIGGEFLVDVFVAAKQVSFPVKDINETIDYSAIYQLIQNIMQEPEPLLETVAGKIVQAIFNKFSHADTVTTTIKKVNPPIIAFEGNVSVKLSLNRSEIHF